jgi:hypothetical protein
MNKYNWGFGIEHEQKIYFEKPIQKEDIENYNKRKNVMSSYGNIYISISPTNINQYIKYTKIYSTYNIIKKNIKHKYNKNEYVYYLLISLKKIFDKREKVGKLNKEIAKIQDKKLKEKMKFIVNYLYFKYNFLTDFPIINLKYYFHLKEDYIVEFLNTNDFSQNVYQFQDNDVFNIIVNLTPFYKKILYFLDDTLFDVLFEKSFFNSINMLWDYLDNLDNKDIKNKYQIFKNFTIDKKLLLQEIKKYFVYKFDLIYYNKSFKLIDVKYIYEFKSFTDEYTRYISDSNFISNELDVFYGIPIFYLKNENKKGNHIKLFNNIFHSLTKRIITNYIPNNEQEYINNIGLNELNKIDINVEIDYSSQSTVLEIKTEKFKNRTVQEIVDELKGTENTVMKIVRMNDCVKMMKAKYGDIQQADFGNYRNEIVFNINECKFDFNLRKTLIQDDYSGSFHTWITVPYNNKTSVNEFMENQTRLGTYLQLFEPMFAAIFTSNNPNMFVNYDDKIMSSYRFSVNQFASYGTSNLRNLFGENYYDNLSYYLNMTDLLNNMGIWKQNMSNLYNKRGELILNYNLLSSRKSFSPLYSPYRTLIPEKVYKEEDKKIHNYFDIIKKKHNIDAIKYSNFLGSDIRTMNWSKNITPPLKPGWYEANILENNKLIRVYCQYNEGVPINITYEPPYDMEKFQDILYNDRIGFEFRIWDHLPTDGMLVIMNIIGLLTTYAVNHNDELFYAIEHQFWHDQIADAIFYGFSSKVHTSYVNHLEKTFKVKITNRTTLYDVLEELVNKLIKKMKNNEIYKILGIKDNLVIPNVNKDNFKYLWEEYLDINEKDRNLWYDILRKKKSIGNYKEYLDLVNSYNNITIKKYAYQLYLIYFS